MSAELIRVAILWHELWHEGLEEASRLYFTEKNPEAMIAVLEPLHDLLEAVCPLVKSALHFGQCFLPLLGPYYYPRDRVCSSVWPRTARRTSVHATLPSLWRDWGFESGMGDLFHGSCVSFCARRTESHAVSCFKVFKKVEKQLLHLTTLDLQYVSPELLRSRNLDIAVPGT